MAQFTVRSDKLPDRIVAADSDVDAAIMYCEQYLFQGQVTVETDVDYVTYDVDFAGISELDREQK